MSFFVSRQVYSGAGKVGTENRAQPCDFQLSQRADFFETEIALDTMVKRPIINTRDEPHADREKYRRLHVIVGDANMSEYTIYLRNGVTAIVLSMIEDGSITRDLTLQDPVRAIKEVSHDSSCTAEIELQNGKRMTAVQIQRSFLEMAENYASTRETESWTRDVLDKWAFVLDALERDPSELSGKIDWVIKKVMIEHFMERKGQGFVLSSGEAGAGGADRDRSRDHEGDHGAPGGYAGLFPRSVPQEVRRRGVWSQLGFDLIRDRRRSDQAGSDG
jgi:proteasome accessory factor A